MALALTNTVHKYYSVAKKKTLFLHKITLNLNAEWSSAILFIFYFSNELMNKFLQFEAIGSADIGVHVNWSHYGWLVGSFPCA